VTLTRRYRFSASHRLHSSALDEETNREVYGKCNNPYGHGHDYVLDVSVRGPLDESTGRIVDLDSLDSLVNEQVLDAFEHRNLNYEVAAFAGSVPTTENVAVEIGRRLRGAWPSVFAGSRSELDKIKIYETRRNIFELSL
jgi:6-pyruvoyltetrahydropterin/6-carboxytetrahydropterin synthase